MALDFKLIGNPRTFDDGRPVNADLRYGGNGILVYPVRAKNAFGDGITDDTAAIQATIDQCHAAGGGITWLGQGAFLVTPSARIYCLQLYDDVILMGAGKGASVLIDNSQHTSAPYTVMAQSCNNVGCASFSILGNAVDTDLASGAQGFGVAFLSCTNFSLYDFAATNMRVGPWTVGRESAQDSCSVGSIENVWAYGFRMNLGYLACCDDVNVNNVYGSTREGFCLEGGPFNRINVNNVVAKSTSVSTGLGFGIEILANWGNLRSVSISNVQVLGNFIDGLRAYANHNGALFNSITDLSLENIHCDGNLQPGSNHGLAFVCDAGCTIDGLQLINTSARNYAQGQGYRFDGAFIAEVVNALSEFNFNQGFAILNGADVRFINARALENNQQAAGGNAGFYIQNGSIARMTRSKASSSQPGFGVAVLDSTSAVFTTDCDLTGNTDGPVSIAANTASIIRTTKGLNPFGASVIQPAVAGSGVAVTNTTKFDCTVFVNGGTVSAVAIGGTATGQTNGMFRVPANQTITLTYTVAPTWKWFAD